MNAHKLVETSRNLLSFRSCFLVGSLQSLRNGREDGRVSAADDGRHRGTRRPQFLYSLSSQRSEGVLWLCRVDVHITLQQSNITFC